tara:strand:- start:1781 stop:2008 length:228 start_codon:yes stop_codon:yes gene_type:complete
MAVQNIFNIDWFTYAEMREEMATILAEELNDQALQRIVDDHGNQLLTHESIDRLEAYMDQAKEILSRLGIYQAEP